MPGKLLGLLRNGPKVPFFSEADAVPFAVGGSIGNWLYFHVIAITGLPQLIVPHHCHHLKHLLGFAPHLIAHSDSALKVTLLSSSLFELS